MDFVDDKREELAKRIMFLTGEKGVFNNGKFEGSSSKI